MPPQQNFPYTVYFDPSIGKFRLNSTWTPAYSAQSRVDRVNQTRQLYSQRRQFQVERALKKLTSSDLPGYGRMEGEYIIPTTGDPEKDLERVEADYLNFQILGQAKMAEQMSEAAEPGGWKGVVHDALDNPVGGVVQRGLDVISRPGYAVAEAADAVTKASRGESPEHTGWFRLQDTGDVGGDESKGWWENRQTGKVEFHPDWEDVSSGPTPMTALKGAGRGLTGKSKTSFVDVLKENEILGGKPGAAAGLVLDVVTDPTNAISFGTSTVAKEAAAEGAEAAARSTARELVQTGAAKGPLAYRRAYRTALKDELSAAGLARKPVKQVIEDVNSSFGPLSVERAMKDRVESALKDPFWAKGNQRKIANTARKVFDAERKVLGLGPDSAGRKAAGLSALRQAREEFTSKVGADVMDEIATRKALKENLHLDVKLAGKTIASSRLGGKAIQKVSKTAKSTRAGGLLARTFRTDAETGEALHRIERQFSNVSSAQFEAEAKAVKDAFKGLGLSKKQRQKISRALETGDTKGFTTEMVEGYDAAKRFFRDAFDREVEAGALRSEDFVDNYLYHVYKEPNFKRGLGSWVKPTGRGAQKFRTLAEAEAAGARPLLDVADILVYRLAKSHRVAASHLMMRSIAGRFGVGLHGGASSVKALKGLADKGVLIEGKKIAGAGRFFDKGVYFDQDVAASLSKMHQMFSNDELITRFGRLFDQVQARMKFLQTAPNPGFHVRNTMSDMFINFLDGVTSAKPYRRAAQLMSGKGDNIVFTLKSGEKLTGAEVRQLYDGMGLRAGFFHAEAGIIPGMGSKLLTGSSNVIRRASEVREDMMRMAHFVDALEKVPKGVGRAEEAAEIAAKRVRKYNFDYQDLTNIEKKVFRRAVPFYTFMRKNVPLMMENYFTNPGRMIVPTKAQNALANFLGEDNRDEPLPGMLSTTPKWISDTPGVELAPQSPTGDQMFMQPDMPYNQLQQLFGGFAEGNTPAESLSGGFKGLAKELLLEQSTPLVRSVAEYATQTDLATGADQKQSFADAVINQFPVGRLVQRPLSGVAPGLFLESDRPGSPTYTVNVAGQKIKIGENVANYITGMGFRKVTPDRMKSELRRRQDIIEGLLRRLKDDAIENEQKKWDEEYGDLYGT